MLFVSGGAIAGTHYAASRLTTCADSDAEFGGALQRSSILRKNEVRFEGRVRVCVRRGIPRGDGAMPQILDGVVHSDSINDLAGVHAIFRIPQRFEFAECQIGRASCRERV